MWLNVIYKEKIDGEVVNKGIINSDNITCITESKTNENVLIAKVVNEPYPMYFRILSEYTHLDSIDRVLNRC